MLVVDRPNQVILGTQPDRFIYRIRAGERRATLPERDLVGPWRVLVETMRAAAESPDQPD